ncbi:MAG TPA: HAMP domain-containing sensor histidine kinase [Gaiellaceae bacterium]|nr:HAMP domain-containing sensor histidine kinase [Gaiellaceae bacterium]
MNVFRSVGAKLALALALVVAVALGIVYAIVVPRLERNLVTAKVEALRATGEPIARTFNLSRLSPQDIRVNVEDYVDEIAFSANARVVVYDSAGAGGLRVIADSRRRSTDVRDDPVAARAATIVAPTTGTVTRDDERFAEAAFPLYTETGTVLLFSASLGDTLANVQLVQRRVAIAAVPALVVAVLLGYGLASAFARRIRRLERAADRIAGGRFDEPVVDVGRDELGELASAFERMRRRLAHLERARREFIANASHELRTPIFSLGGFLELLTSEELDEATRREFLGTMQEQVARLQKLATDLLDLSRLDAGQLLVELEPLGLRAVADAVADEFTAVAQASQHELTVSGEGEALGDEQRVLQIGRILVENAIRHTAPGTAIRIDVAAANGAATLTVEDEGPGIPVEHREQVFDRFYRIQGNRASGSGLGLAIARELAELMDGSIELEGESGRTRFRLRLPAAAPARSPVAA